MVLHPLFLSRIVRKNPTATSLMHEPHLLILVPSIQFHLIAENESIVRYD